MPSWECQDSLEIVVKFQRAQTRGIQSLGRVGSPSAYAVNSVTLRALFFVFTFYLVHMYACTCAICEGLRKITGLCFSPVPCGSRESKLRSSGLAASAESPLALGGVLSGQEPRGWIFFNRSVRLRSSGSTTDRTRAASPEGECSAVTLETNRANEHPEQPLLEPQASREQRSFRTPTTSGGLPARISSGPAH